LGPAFCLLYRILTGRHQVLERRPFGQDLVADHGLEPIQGREPQETSLVEFGLIRQEKLSLAFLLGNLLELQSFRFGHETPTTGNIDPRATKKANIKVELPQFDLGDIAHHQIVMGHVPPSDDKDFGHGVIHGPQGKQAVGDNPDPFGGEQFGLLRHGGAAVEKNAVAFANERGGKFRHSLLAQRIDGGLGGHGQLGSPLLEVEVSIDGGTSNDPFEPALPFQFLKVPTNGDFGNVGVYGDIFDRDDTIGPKSFKNKLCPLMCNHWWPLFWHVRIVMIILQVPQVLHGEESILLRRYAEGENPKEFLKARLK